MNRIRSRLVTLVVVSIVAGTVAAEARGVTRVFKLSRVAAMQVDGNMPEGLGFTAPGVVGVGDVNGDGTPDLGVAGCGDGGFSKTAGSAYVVFGRRSGGRVKVASLGSRGFAIRGSAAADEACHVHRLGDVNGDGLDDIAVGAPSAEVGVGDSSVDQQTPRANAGKVYIVFGKKDTNEVRLQTFDTNTQGTAGYRIDGPSNLSIIGEEVAGVGDINGDDLFDIAVGAPNHGDVYVVFGKKDPLPIDLLLLGVVGPNGYSIQGPASAANALFTVEGPGDINGDDIPDIAIGSCPPRSATEYDACLGRLYVVFGKSVPESVVLRQLGQGGYQITGVMRASGLDLRPGVAGDMNGDGLGDLLVGQTGGGYEIAQDFHPGVYVIYGQKALDSIDVRESLGSRGWTILRAQGGIYGLAGAGDLNKDGIPDLLLGDGSAGGGGKYRGSVYAIFGKRHRPKVSLKALGRHGYRVDGVRDGDAAGVPSGLGDINGDGRDDFGIAAHGAGQRGAGMQYHEAGRVYVVWGRG